MVSRRSLTPTRRGAAVWPDDHHHLQFPHHQGTPTAFTQEAAPVHISLMATDTRETPTARPMARRRAEQHEPLRGDPGSAARYAPWRLERGSVGQAYPSTTFTTPPGSGSYTFSLIAPEFSTTGYGSVPPGMTFNAGQRDPERHADAGGPVQSDHRGYDAGNGIIDSRVFHLTVGADTGGLQLGSGNDSIALGDGNDYVSAGSGNDNVTVGNGNDSIQLDNGFRRDRGGQRQ